MHIPPAPIADPPAAHRHHWGWYWSVAFAANLPIPAFLGWEYTAANGGLIGMSLAVVALYTVGLRLCATGPDLRRVLVRGAARSAACQLFPVPQLVAGIIALFAFNQVWRPEDGFGAEVRGLVVTVMTGVPLALFAFLLGGGWGLLRTAPATEQAEDYG
jgi:hypothetical protein